MPSCCPEPSFCLTQTSQLFCDLFQLGVELIKHESMVSFHRNRIDYGPILFGMYPKFHCDAQGAEKKNSLRTCYQVWACVFELEHQKCLVLSDKRARFNRKKDIKMCVRFFSFLPFVLSPFNVGSAIPMRFVPGSMSHLKKKTARGFGNNSPWNWFFF